MSNICPNCGFENDEHAKFCKKCGTKLIDETFNGSNINQNNNTKKWAIILATIAICLIIIITAVVLTNQNSESTYQNETKNAHLTIHNGTWGYTFKKGEDILVQMKDTTNWEAMSGCMVTVDLKHEEKGYGYTINRAIGEDSYAYIDTSGLPLGKYKLYASYYDDENHYANYYTDIEIVP